MKLSLKKEIRFWIKLKATFSVNRKKDYHRIKNDIMIERDASLT